MSPQNNIEERSYITQQPHKVTIELFVKVNEFEIA